jgi:hypothetical protein
LRRCSSVVESESEDEDWDDELPLSSRSRVPQSPRLPSPPSPDDDDHLEPPLSPDLEPTPAEDELNHFFSGSKASKKKNVIHKDAFGRPYYPIRSNSPSSDKMLT